MERQPQNPEFRNNPENVHPCRQFTWDFKLCFFSSKKQINLKLLSAASFRVN